MDLNGAKKLEFQISLVGAQLNVPLAIETAHYQYLHRRESCIRQGAKEADVMVLPMDMCDYDAHSGNFRNVCSGSLFSRILPSESLIQRHILGDRRRGTTACPACWAMGTSEVK
jgi:hypothetical protein